MGVTAGPIGDCDAATLVFTCGDRAFRAMLNERRIGGGKDAGDKGCRARRKREAGTQKGPESGRLEDGGYRVRLGSLPCVGGLGEVCRGCRCRGRRGGGTGRSNEQSTMRSVKVYDKEPTRARASLRLPASWQTQGASPNGNLGRIMIIAVRTPRLSFLVAVYCFSWPGSTRCEVEGHG